MKKDVIEKYDTFTSQGFPNELIFGYFNDQPIPSDYYNLRNDNNEYGNNVPGTPVEYVLPNHEGLEYPVVPNFKINEEIIIMYDDDRLASDIDLL